MYFNAAATFHDDDFKARLGIQSYYDDALTGAPRVKYTGGYNSSASACTAVISDVATFFYNVFLNTLLEYRKGNASSSLKRTVFKDA